MADTSTPSNSVQGVAIIVFLGGIFNVGLGTLFLLEAGAASVETAAGVAHGLGITSILIGSICGAAAIGFWRLRKWAWTTVAVFLWIDVCFRALALLVGGVTLVDAIALCFFVGLLFLVYRVRSSFAPAAAQPPLLCPRCGHEQTPDARYCPACGEDLLRCPSCGQTHAPLAESCSRCQKPLLPPTIASSEKDERASADGSQDDGAGPPA